MSKKRRSTGPLTAASFSFSFLFSIYFLFMVLEVVIIPTVRGRPGKLKFERTVHVHSAMCKLREKRTLAAFPCSQCSRDSRVLSAGASPVFCLAGHLD